MPLHFKNAFMMQMGFWFVKIVKVYFAKLENFPFWVRSRCEME